MSQKLKQKIDVKTEKNVLSTPGIKPRSLASIGKYSTSTPAPQPTFWTILFSVPCVYDQNCILSLINDAFSALRPLHRSGIREMGNLALIGSGVIEETEEGSDPGLNENYDRKNQSKKMRGVS